MRTLLALTLIACGSSAAPEAPKAADARVVDILIDGNGYTPTQIDAAPGEMLTLRFDRPDAANCGETVWFKATNERHTIPVGEITEVAVMAPPSGTLAFACGMDMYQGSIVVGAK